MEPENDTLKKNDERAAQNLGRRKTGIERQAIKCLYTRQGALMYQPGTGVVVQKDGVAMQVESAAVYDIYEMIRPDGSMWFQIFNENGECWREINSSSVSEIDYFTKDDA